MNIKVDNIDDLMKNSDKIPAKALKDICRRIGDWLESGGDMKDPYIKQQFRYAERILNKPKEED